MIVKHTSDVMPVCMKVADPMFFSLGDCLLSQSPYSSVSCFSYHEFAKFAFDQDSRKILQQNPETHNINFYSFLPVSGEVFIVITTYSKSSTDNCLAPMAFKKSSFKKLFKDIQDCVEDTEVYDTHKIMSVVAFFLAPMQAVY